MKQVTQSSVFKDIKDHKGMKLLSTLSMALPMFLGSVEKASAARVVDSLPTSTSINMGRMLPNYVTIHKGSWSDPGVHQSFSSVNGDVMYCLEPQKATPSGSKAANGTANDAVRAVLRAGYGGEGGNLGTASADEAEMATQLAVWSAAGAIDSIDWTPPTNGSHPADQAATNRVHAAYNALMAKANDPSWRSDGVTQLKITNDGDVQHDAANNAYKQNMKVEATQGGAAVNTDVKLTIQAPEGTVIQQNGQTVTNNTVKANQDFTVVVRNQDTPGTVSVSATADAVSYQAAQYSGGSQQSSVTLLGVKTSPVTAQGSFNYKATYPELSGQKINDESEIMPNVKFGIYEDNNGQPGKLVTTVTSDKDGMIHLSDSDHLKYTTYCLKEIETTKDMILDKTPHKFSYAWNQTTYDAGKIMNNHMVPTVGTTATNKEDGSKVLQPIKGNVTINDKVAYDHVIPGKEYTIKGTLMDKSTGKALLVNGKEVIVTKNFTPTESTGTIDVQFTLNASALAGKEVVVFEDLIRTSKPDHYTTKHENINDEGQTVKFTNPSIHTKATNNETDGKKLQPTDKEDLKDTVSYTDLVPGKTYTMKGVLMDKDTGKPVMVNGKQVTAEKTFTPTSANGTVDIHFIFDASKLASKNLVVFETAYYNGTELVDHKDLKDENQSVSVTNPQLHTTLFDNAQKLVSPKSDNTVQDVVKYSDLLPGVKYTVRGKLMDQVTGQPVEKNGTPVTATATFTPNQANGTVTVTFHFDGTQYKGHALVAFEDLYDNGRLVVSHEDINDTAQTVLVDHPKGETPLPNTPTPSTPSTSTSSTPSSSTSAASVLPQTDNGKTNPWTVMIASTAIVVIVGSAVAYTRRHATGLN
ncbi:hypothetical protein FOD75_11550 (plasmid) [Limosilactobacillus reuteri]|uniref:VaFE repeat-containing surface-anchored protein n=1 Tax=Limosilactobacillus reuteri TaxID=1598 RepID=A0A517D8P7_LIMRT|nr:VaFE repeat-containing surface-anchored protein [Limosilactobacillus reuteri]QDR73716.1 hypothetical protein FOD75_11550 [Limosilactobacillus reuteri]